jgi:hypothetical protein
MKETELFEARPGRDPCHSDLGEMRQRDRPIDFELIADTRIDHNAFVRLGPMSRTKEGADFASTG